MGEFEIQSRIAHPLATDHDISNLGVYGSNPKPLQILLLQSILLSLLQVIQKNDFFLRFELAQKGVKKSTFSDKKSIFPF